ncbi:nicotinate (nicotinamide) nucleotide adenylyltransferase [Rhodovulum kholense]|uniref:Probable nicotinate-nucleotide adenylyltransferase n=1 Tax=Rhodovulum kholense TaxID=453584 RepID=A0A8E2VJ90_9RHOB|nr:nicotinate (nicotinamide) nucleotide adenylyltransferase [Rhodovulum kholense]PTW47698.1 nicotinate-nucleotide adenylyltransferase [Rhodovulum kholense]
MRVALFGGSFDPVHEGHLAAAVLARQALDLDRVILIPAGSTATRPGPKAQAVASAAHRLAMLRLLCEGRPWLEVSDAECRPGASPFAVDTLALFHRTLPAGTDIVLLIGSDKLALLPRWHGIDAIRASARIVALDRPGHPLDAAPPWVERLGGPLPDLSSTQIRARLAAGGPLDGLCPSAVISYLMTEQPYARPGPAARFA